jgi:hypothetical protein
MKLEIAEAILFEENQKSKNYIRVRKSKMKENSLLNGIT